MRPKRMEYSAVFNAREVKRATAEERERDEYSSAEDNESRSKKQSHPNELSENGRETGRSLWQKTGERERLVQLVGNQNPGPEASSRSKRVGNKRDVRRRATA